MADQAIRRVIEIDVKESAAAAAAVRDMQRNLKALEKTADDTKESLKDAFGGKLGFNVAAFGQIASGVNSVVEAVKGFSGGTLTTSILEIQSGLERLRLGFSSISSGGIQAANDTIEYLRKTTRALGVDFTTAADAFLKLSAAARGTSIDGAKTRDLFESLSLASRNLGLTADQSQHAFLALQQIISKGVVQQEELRGQLSEALPGATQIAARALGLTTAKLNDLIASGKLFAEDFIPKFSAQLRKEFGQEVPAGLNEATVALNSFKSSYDQLLQSITDGNLGHSAAETLSGLTLFFDDVAKAARNAKGASGDFVQQIDAIAKEFDKIQSLRSKRIELAELLAAGNNPTNARGKAPSPPGFDDAVLKARKDRIAVLNQEIEGLTKLDRKIEEDAKLRSDGVVLSKVENNLLDDKTSQNTRLERAENDLIKRYKDKTKTEEQDLKTAKELLDAGRYTVEFYNRQVELIRAKNKTQTDAQKLDEQQFNQIKHQNESVLDQIQTQRELGLEQSSHKNIVAQLAKAYREYGASTTEATDKAALQLIANLKLLDAETKAADQRIAVMKTNKELNTESEKRIQTLYREAEADEAMRDNIGSSKEQIRQKKIDLMELRKVELELLTTEEMFGENNPALLARYRDEVNAINRAIDAKRSLTSKEFFGTGPDNSELEAKQLKEAEKQREEFSKSLVAHFKSSKNLGKAVIESIKDELDKRVFKLLVEPQVDFLVSQLDKILNSFADGLKKVIDQYLSSVNGGDGGFVSFIAKLIGSGLSSGGASESSYSNTFGSRDPTPYVEPSSVGSSAGSRRTTSSVASPVYSATVTPNAGPSSQDGMGGWLTVNIINAPQGTTATERSTPNGRILDVIIAQAKDAVAGDIASGGKVSAAIQSTYGVTRSTPRVGF